MSDPLWEQAQRLHASRLFGTRSPEHAYAIVLIGAEVGVGPTTALTQIAVIQGKPAFGAALVGALVKKSGRYDYDVTEMTDQAVTVRFTEHVRPVPGVDQGGNRLLGDSRFTLQDAQRAGLGTSPTWQRFPRNLLLARALTNGARWYCPDILAGAAYTAEEIADGSAPEPIPVPGVPDAAAVTVTLDVLVERYGAEAVLEAGGGELPSTPDVIASLAEHLAAADAAAPDEAPTADAGEAA